MLAILGQAGLPGTRKDWTTTPGCIFCANFFLVTHCIQSTLYLVLSDSARVGPALPLINKATRGRG